MIRTEKQEHWEKAGKNMEQMIDTDKVENTERS